MAVDAGVDHLFRHGGVTPDAVRDLVYGAMFTRGPADLKNTAVFIGGSDVAAGEKLLAKAQECFFGPMRVSRDARLERREHHGRRRRAQCAKARVAGTDATVTGSRRDGLGRAGEWCGCWLAKARTFAWLRGNWRGRSRFATASANRTPHAQFEAVRNTR